MVMKQMAYPVKVMIIIQAAILLASLPMAAVAAEKDVWQIVFEFQMKLARQGNAAAQEKVAEMFEEGRGVKQTFDKARYWYSKAANQGHKGAIEKLNGLPERIKLHKASKAAKEQDAKRQRLRRERAAKEKAAREHRLREQRAAERLKAAREKALREQQAAERRLKAAREKSLRKQSTAKRQQTPGNNNPRSQQGLSERERPDAAAKQQSRSRKGQADKITDSQVFKADPCKGKAARFMSTCKNKSIRKNNE